MELLKRVLNSFLFWGAWIVIPVLMEIIPALVGVFLLLRRRRRQKGYPAPAIYPEISIIIPVYNSQDTLYGCIESINNCSYPNSSIRIFLVNNKSPDDSFSVYAQCQRKFPELRMQWLNAEQGKSRALNLALYNSEGKYIINLDSDGLLEHNALKNLITKFEALPDLNCMTGAILTLPEAIKRYKSPFGRLLRDLEYMEYAQAFLAGRSYASETNSVYTLSGAFSAFRKSAVLTSWMYNTDTICEDTHITFQMRYRQHERVEICEDAIFFVDPIEDVNKLYTQRQRWQRGSLEVAQMFMDKNFKPTKIISDVNVRTLLYDHTFAFPRMIWYLALICLLFMNYSAKMILLSTLAIFAMYIVIGYLYFFTTARLLRFSKEARRYYVTHWWCVALLPLFNLIVFFIRMAGIINSISTTSSWRTKNLTEEWEAFTQAVRSMAGRPLGWLKSLRRAVSRPAPQGEGADPQAGRTYGVGWTVGVVLLYLTGILLLLAVSWSKRAFGVEIGEIVTTLLGPIEGTGGGMMDEVLSGLVLPLSLAAAALIALAVAGTVIGRRRRKRGEVAPTRRYRLTHRVVSGLGAAALLTGALYGNAQYGLLDYYVTSGTRSHLYENYYVDPADVAITAPANPKNLIYIYVESFETTYASQEAGGAQPQNYIPQMTALAQENLNFSDNGALGGFHATYGTTWTMAALLASTAGIPYGLPPAETTLADADYLPGAVTLGDVLAENGYVQEFICGSDGHFAGRQEYFELHGDYDVCDLYRCWEKGYVPEGYRVNWGMEDERLFEAARTEITELAGQGKPFNFTLLTVDLHAPNGFVCDWCPDGYPSDTATVAACSDRQVADFIAWCQTQDFWEDTVVVVTGDHPRMDNNLVDGVAYYDRTVYNCFINTDTEVAGDPKARSFTTMDLFPTVLASLGFEIEGDQLALGTNLFSGKKTLLENQGGDWLSSESSKRSEYYLTKFAQQ